MLLHLSDSTYSYQVNPLLCVELLTICFIPHGTFCAFMCIQTVQATYLLVLGQLTAGLKALREDCRQTALANQAIIRANLDQIMSSHSFLEQKVRGTSQ